MSTAQDRVHRYSGTPREVGRAAGRALGASLAETIDRYLRERPGSPEALDLGKLRRGAMPWLRTLPERFQEEIEGLAEGAGIPLQRVAEWNYVETCVDDGCSGLVALLDGHQWIGRNNDMFVPGIWGDVTIRGITGRIPTLTFGQHGDVFTATGINRERLWLHHQALTAADSRRTERRHFSGWILLTEMLETCSDIAQVEAALDSTDRDEGMILFAVDGKTDEVAVFECDCARHLRRTAPDRFVAATNHASALHDATDHGESATRLDAVESAAARLFAREQNARLPDDLVAILADDRVERRGARLATVYATVACPATGELWFTFGAWPAASRGSWSRVDWPW